MPRLTRPADTSSASSSALRLWSLIGLVLWLAISLSACGDDDYGSPCVSDRDCDGVCAEGKDFPGGVCTYSCSNNSHCEEGWVCIDKDGGVCLQTCPEKLFCENRYNSYWTCKDEGLLGVSAKTKVCIGD